MKVNTMINKLTKLRDELGDVEVYITDGYECVCYRGNDECDFSINKYDNNVKVVIDIGIGGCNLE